MKLGKGTVKKYTREYSRTLKNGTKKKYTTQQIQITVSKQDDIYENGEEVLIIPESEKEEFEDVQEQLVSYEVFNGFLLEELNKLNEEAEIINKNELDKIQSKYEDLAEKETIFNEIKAENDELKNNVDSLKKKYIQSEQDYTELENYYNELAEKYNKLVEEYTILEEKQRYNKLINKKYKRFLLNKN